MHLNVDRVAIDGPHGELVPTTSLSVHGGQLAIVHGTPGPALTALALAITGRLNPTNGTVTSDGGTLPAEAAVVDSPGVSEPDNALPLRVVVAEELALAGRRPRRDEVDATLSDHDLLPYAGTRFEELTAARRTSLLTGLAAARPGVRLLVLDAPDRHTSTVDDWLTPAREHAAQGLAVVVLTGTTPPAVLPAAPAVIGHTEQPEPIDCIDEEETA